MLHDLETSFSIFHGFDPADIESDLIDAGDWDAVLELRGLYARHRPDDPHVQLYLAEAHFDSGDPPAALELLRLLHRKHPSFEECQWLLLDTLYAMGLTEDDFEWSERPAVLRLEAGTLDACQERLEGAAEPVTVADLYALLSTHAYLAFDPDELTVALAAGPRFEVSDGCCAHHRRVVLAPAPHNEDRGGPGPA